MRGILKNPIHGPRRSSHSRLRTTSSENLLFDSKPSHPKLFSLTRASSTDDCENQDTDRDDGDDMVQVPLQSEGSDTEQNRPASTSRQRPPPKVQFPESLEKVASIPTFFRTHTRQDSDAVSSGAPSIAGTDDEDSDDFHWSDDEDLVDQEAKFGKHMGVKEVKRGWGLKRILSLLFSSLIGSTLLAAILVTPGVLVHFFWYKKHPTEHRRYIKDNVQAWLFWAAANIIISWYLAMVIDVVPILFRYAVSAVWGHVSEAIKTRIELYVSVKDTIKPAFYAASAYASWAIIFQDVFSLHNASTTASSSAQYTNRLSQVVEFFFFLFLVWCGQRMLSHFIAFSFHRTAYKERVEEVEKALLVVEKLRQYRPKLPTPQRPGTRTPVFGGLGFPTTLTDKQHSRLLSKALKNATPISSRTNTNTSHGKDAEDDEDIELEEADRTLVNKKGKAPDRYSWFNGSGETSELGHLERQQSGQTDEYDKEKSKMAIEKEGLQAEIEMSPMAPATGQLYTARPATPSMFNPHRYPPAGSPRESEDGHTADAALKQAAKLFKDAILHDARNITGQNEEKDGLSWNVSSSHEAKHLARSIWMKFRAGRSWLIPADFYPAFPDHVKAEEAFKVFDKDGNGDISRSELKQSVIRVYKERRFLARSMRDVGEALKTLDRILLFFAAVVLFFIALSIFGVNVTKSLTSMYTLGIAASFVFKNAASSAFDAIMLLFVTHPYDTGDRVIIGTENLIVRKVGLFATVFGRSDGSETYYFNSQLFSQFILNVRRSGKTFENLVMQVAWDTSLTKLDALEKCLNDWLSTEENRWYEPSTNITLSNIQYQRYLELTIGIGHNGNWQDWGLRLARKTAFHAAVQYYCHQLGIVGYESPLPVVFANPATLTYQPRSLAEEAQSPTEQGNAELLKEETMKEAKSMKPTLGFLPPLADRSSHLIRARKSKNRKANMGASNA